MSDKPSNPLRKVAESLRAARARHKERHQPTGFGFAFADRVDYLNRETWRLSLGRTALEPKAALGAKPESMAVWLRHRVPALNWLMRGILGAVPHSEAPERNPFKAASGTPPSERESTR